MRDKEDAIRKIQENTLTDFAKEISEVKSPRSEESEKPVVKPDERVMKKAFPAKPDELVGNKYVEFVENAFVLPRQSVVMVDPILI